jgi:hypothetical protein
MKLRAMMPAPVQLAEAAAPAPRTKRPKPAGMSSAGIFGNRAFTPLGGAHPPRPDSVDAPLNEPWLTEDAKPAFLANLRASVEQAAAEALAGTGFTPANCPYLQYWFEFFATQPAAKVERAIPRYAPEAAGVRDAAVATVLITARIQRSVETWALSGEVSGVPEGVPLDVPGTHAAHLDPRILRMRLRAGRPLPVPVRAQMESAFRLPFPDVRIHTGEEAGDLARRAGARAFALGKDIVFGPGEFRPGTPQGDALLAHEMAHVAQQQSAAAPEPLAAPAAERDASRATIGVLAGLWGGVRGMFHSPALRTGLALARCSGTQTAVQSSPQSGSAAGMIECPTTPLEGDAWRHAVIAANGETDPGRKAAAQGRLVANAVCGLGIRVHMATQNHPDQEHPDDYVQAGEQANVVNFDPRHSSKKKYGQTVTIGPNFGHTFSRGPDDAFSIVNPAAIEDTTPLVTRQSVQHELFHATHHRGGATGSDADQELETYTNDFVNYFHRYYGAGLPLSERPVFEPLSRFYAAAGTGAKAATRARLLQHYRTPPEAVGDVDRFRREFRRYLTRFRAGATGNPNRSPELANDLLSGIGAATP